MSDFTEWEQTLFQMILHAGSAHSHAKEAAEKAKEGNWQEAEKSLQLANDEQTLAHKINTSIITKASRGEDIQFSVILVHAMDLMMLAWSEIDYSGQYINLSKRIQSLEAEVVKLRK